MSIKASRSETLKVNECSAHYTTLLPWPPMCILPTPVVTIICSTDLDCHSLMSLNPYSSLLTDCLHPKPHRDPFTLTTSHCSHQTLPLATETERDLSHPYNYPIPASSSPRICVPTALRSLAALSCTPEALKTTNGIERLHSSYHPRLLLIKEIHLLRWLNTFRRVRHRQ